ncbi:MAG: LysR family transcriptional regulator [Paracoccaceae bacterium]|nr:LysR family transcriptional regulator [Paracoccaceae bacterium]
MDVSLFRDLERLHQTGNFSRAATLSNLSQPAFSRRIKSLENWAGALLVDRSRQPVRLTEAGHQMLDAGLQALSRIELERSQILASQALPDRYVVTFGAQHSIGWRFYPRWLQALEDAYGPILSRLRADDLPNCLQDLQNGQVDFVVAYGSQSSASTDDPASILIGKDRLIPVSKPTPEGAAVFDFKTPELTPFLRFGDTAPITALMEPTLIGFDLKRRLRTVYENSMAGALRMRARAGDGVAWLPETLIAPDIDAGLLVPTGAEAWQVALDIRLYRNEPRSNHTTRAIWNFLERLPSDGLLPHG